MSLNLQANLTSPDDAYALLLEAHEGLTKAQSDALNARLILVLMNHVGDMDVIRAAIEAARE